MEHQHYRHARAPRRQSQRDLRAVVHLDQRRPQPAHDPRHCSGVTHIHIAEPPSRRHRLPECHIIEDRAGLLPAHDQRGLHPRKPAHNQPDRSAPPRSKPLPRRQHGHNQRSFG